MIQNSWDAARELARDLRHSGFDVPPFSIEFEFKSRLLDAFLAANMDRAIDKLIACFEARARALYGAETATQEV